jgi:hypothetical protein
MSRRLKQMNPPVKRGSTRFRHRMRCRVSSCYSRLTIKRAPHKYVRAIRCPVCGSENVKSVELERRREAAKKDVCRCDAYPFPHDRATLVGCRFHPERLAGIPMTDDQLDAYHITLTTPRTDCCYGWERPATPDDSRLSSMNPDDLPEAPF